MFPFLFIHSDASQTPCLKNKHKLAYVRLLMHPKKQTSFPYRPVVITVSLALENGLSRPCCRFVSVTANCPTYSLVS